MLLAIVLFALPWYGFKPAVSPVAGTLGLSTSFNGWQSLSHTRWLLVLTILAAVALAYFQATRRAPAIPVTLSVIVTALGLVSLLALIYRVLINVPGPDSILQAKAGAYVGLLCAVGVLIGAILSMRQEGISPHDAPAEIETIRSRAPAGS